MNEFVLLLGGARSGKSSYAEEMAAACSDSVLYLATAEAKDEEMAERIARHRESRPQTWRTLEAPRGAAAALKEAWQGEKVILLDCITLLVTNLLPSGEGFEQVAVQVEEYEHLVLEEVEALIEFIAGTDALTLVVSNEVGMGLVPPYELGRAYRDILGRANKALAQAADRVLLLVAGIPMQVK
ncbi:MAG: bifunctional adenosylcobinamide kinase/adenosylcobinamide-phosphate guanylyltransferase [Anaerolineales bacterium]|jgi:adenosylcobinamide kinase/adenosylcobinamide-phosphate guanylyltransferase